MKPTKRKAFNFLRSYFDVINELPDDKDKLSFLIAIIEKQFLNKDPEGLEFIAKLCYESQRHQIETSVKGWERASNDTLGTTPPTPLGTTPPTTPKEEEEEEEVQGEEKEEEKEEEEEKQTRKNALVDEKIKKLEAFNFWWDVYDKKTDRSKCLKKFLTLSIEDMRKCYDHSKLYAKAQPDKQYRRNPITYLNNENWKEDEFTKPRTTIKPGGLHSEETRNNLERLKVRWAEM
jgi:hypothetical protein